MDKASLSKPDDLNKKTAIQRSKLHTCDREQALPCTNCEKQTKTCSSYCKELHQFLRWTDENRAGVRDQAREIHVSTDFLDVIDQKYPDLPDWQDIASAGIDYGQIDLSILKPRDQELFEDRYIRGMVIKKLAEKYGLTIHGIKSRIKRIRRKIKENCYLILLKQAYPDETFPIQSHLS